MLFDLKTLMPESFPYVFCSLYDAKVFFSFLWETGYVLEVKVKAYCSQENQSPMMMLLSAVPY